MCTSLDSLNEPSAPVSSSSGRETAERWRVGEHYGIHVYEGDRPVATFHNAEDAARAVAAVAGVVAAVTAERERADAERAGLRERIEALEPLFVQPQQPDDNGDRDFALGYNEALREVLRALGSATKTASER